jgi:hypothetical protein
MPEKRAILWDMDGVWLIQVRCITRPGKSVEPYDSPIHGISSPETFGMTNTAIITEFV